MERDIGFIGFGSLCFLKVFGRKPMASSSHQDTPLSEIDQIQPESGLPPRDYLGRTVPIDWGVPVAIIGVLVLLVFCLCVAS